MPLNPENKIITLITGTSKGIGKNLAEYYLAKEHIVIGCSRGEQTVFNNNYHHIKANICIEKDALNIFSYIRKNFKKLAKNQF